MGLRRLINKVAQHDFGVFPVRDDAVFERAHGDDAAGRFPNHGLGFFADSQRFAGGKVNGDDRRLAQDYAAPANVNERVGGPEINADLVPEVT